MRMVLKITTRQYSVDPKPALEFVRTSLDQRTWHQTNEWYQVDMAFSPIWATRGRRARNSETQYHYCEELWLRSKDETVVNEEYKIATEENSHFKFDNCVHMRITVRNPLMKIDSIQTIFLAERDPQDPERQYQDPERQDQESERQEQESERKDDNFTGMFRYSVTFSEIPEDQVPSREPEQWDLSFNFDLVDLVATDHTTRVSCVTFRHPSSLIQQWAPRADNFVSQVTPILTQTDVKLERSANVAWRTGGKRTAAFAFIDGFSKS